MRKPILRENGIPVGNVYAKYETGNPIARRLVANFTSNVLDLVHATGAGDIHEVGCGEGHLTELIATLGPSRLRGSDMSSQMIADARARSQGSAIQFNCKNIYELDTGDSAQLIICCEVLEHLDDPARALRVVSKLNPAHCVFSVPREPLWRILNMLRGKYVGDFGNTPGHIQHWNSAAFVKMIREYFDVVEIRRPLPWTMVLCRSRSN